MNNIIPSTTGAANAVIEVIPEIRSLGIGSQASSLRVPTNTASIVILDISLIGEYDNDYIHGIFRKYSERNPDIMKYHVTTHRYGQPAHDVRSPIDKNALEYVTVHRPTEHTGGGTAGFVGGDFAAGIAGQDNKTASADAMGVCMFPAGHWAGKTVDFIKAATGWTDFTEEDLNKVGAREFAMARLFDIHTQQLTDPKEQWDKLVPHRWFNDPLPNGPFKGAVAYEGNPDKLFNEALPAYWKERGWTEDKGIPTLETLKALGIDDVAGPIAQQHL